MSGSHEPFAQTIDQIVAALRHDPILLTQMMGNGHTAELDALLHARRDAAKVPVFVVVTRTPDGVSGTDVDQQVASLVHAGLGRPGIYVVHTSAGDGAVATYGDIDATQTDDDTLLSLARYTGDDQVTAAVHQAHGDAATPAAVSEAGVVLDLAAHPTIPDYQHPVLTAAEVAELSGPAWVSTGYVEGPTDAVEPATLGLSSLVAVAVGLVVTVVAYRLLQATTGMTARRAARAATSAAASDAGATSARVEDADRRERARTALAELEALLDGDAATRAAGDRIDLATGSRDVVVELLDSDQPLDLVGAWVLAQEGSRALAQEGRPAYRCCYVNPLHGEATAEADVGGGASVPTCAACASAVQQGQPLEPLLDRRRPYYEGRTVWARTGFGSLVDDLWIVVQKDRQKDRQKERQR